jgi:hypothetical protein
MKTLDEVILTRNMSTDERAFRAVVGLGILSSIVAGLVTAPVAIFVLSLISVYLIMTTISGIDLVYSVARWIGQYLFQSSRKLGQDSA